MADSQLQLCSVVRTLNVLGVVLQILVHRIDRMWIRHERVQNPTGQLSSVYVSDIMPLVSDAEQHSGVAFVLAFETQDGSLEEVDVEWCVH
jgi:hypothetical protein